jgi:hypothetical protein
MPVSSIHQPMKRRKQIDRAVDCGAWRDFVSGRVGLVLATPCVSCLGSQIREGLGGSVSSRILRRFYGNE